MRFTVLPRPALLFLTLACAGACASSEVGDDGDSEGDDNGPSGGSGGSSVPPDAFVIQFPDAGPLPSDPSDEPERPPPGWNCGARCFRDDTLDPSSVAPEKVGDGTPSSELSVVYPLASSLHPINLPDLTVHWRRGADRANAYRIRFAVMGGDTYDFFGTCKPPEDGAPPEECVYLLHEGSWLDLAWAARDREVDLTVTAVGDAPKRSEPVRIRFSAASVQGGLYYWSTALMGTYRLPFGARKAAPFITPESSTNRFMCGGCHAVSRNGNVIAFAAEQAGYLTVSSTEDPTKRLIDPPMPPVSDGHVMTLSPDGKLVLSSYGITSTMDNGKIAVRDTQTGKEISKLDPKVLGLPETRVYFPEWSPDGKEIVATVASQDERPWSVNNGYIVVFPYNNGAFGPAQVVVPKEADAFSFYPTWSPDGKWIAFSSAPIKVKSYDNPDARLRLVSRNGGMIYELGRATQGRGNTSTWPKFAPFMQAGGKLMFITFNSKIDYGLILKNKLKTDEAHPQLWMSAIDLRKLDANDNDPSWAPVWLPFQDTHQRNHLGYWTERVVCSQMATCGESASCDKGQCTPVID